jgi:hypothetical protein
VSVLVAVVHHNNFKNQKTDCFFAASSPPHTGTQAKHKKDMLSKRK